MNIENEFTSGGTIDFDSDNNRYGPKISMQINKHKFKLANQYVNSVDLISGECNRKDYKIFENIISKLQEGQTVKIEFFDWFAEFMRLITDSKSRTSLFFNTDLVKLNIVKNEIMEDNRFTGYYVLIEVIDDNPSIDTQTVLRFENNQTRKALNALWCMLMADSKEGSLHILQQLVQTYADN